MFSDLLCHVNLHLRSLDWYKPSLQNHSISSSYLWIKQLLGYQPTLQTHMCSYTSTLRLLLKDCINQRLIHWLLLLSKSCNKGLNLVDWGLSSYRMEDQNYPIDTFVDLSLELRKHTSLRQKELRNRGYATICLKEILVHHHLGYPWLLFEVLGLLLLQIYL